MLYKIYQVTKGGYIRLNAAMPTKTETLRVINRLAASVEKGKEERYIVIYFQREELEQLPRISVCTVMNNNPYVIWNIPIGE